jgi:hypothetical protein
MRNACHHLDLWSAALLPADIDATGIHWLDDLVDELREDSIQLVLGNPAKMVRLP